MQRHGCVIKKLLLQPRFYGFSPTGQYIVHVTSCLALADQSLVCGFGRQERVTYVYVCVCVRASLCECVRVSVFFPPGSPCLTASSAGLLRSCFIVAWQTKLLNRCMNTKLQNKSRFLVRFYFAKSFKMMLQHGLSRMTKRSER